VGWPLSTYIDPPRAAPYGRILNLQTVPPPQPPKEQPPVSFVPVNRGDLFETLKWLRAEVYPGLVGHPLDDEGIAAWLCDNYIRYRQTMGHEDARHRVFADIEAVVNQTRPPIDPPITPPTTLAPLRIEGTTFRLPDGAIWKYRAVTAFSAFQDFLEGRDLTPYAAWTRSVGGNAWRIFGTWVITGFDPRRYGWTELRDGLEAFHRFTRGQGLRLHATVFCDQVDGSSVLLDAADQDRLLDLYVGVLQGEMIGVVNEAFKNGGTGLSSRFGADRFRGVFAERSSWQDGERPDAPGSLLDFTSEHTPRDAEWMRKAKNLLETSVQGMEKIGWSASRKPAVGGEPIGIFEREIAGSRTATPSDVGDYYAVAELFAAGACLHGDGATLQRCNLPGPTAQACAEAAKAAREAIPADAQLGSYTRGGLDDCPLEHSDDRALRTFATISGNRATAVVVRPVAGWEPRTRNGWRVDSVGGPNGHIVQLSR
jgi:hypothetical protein